MVTQSADGPPEPRTYRAFVSYSHRDADWGRWLHRALERYRPPRGTAATPGPIRPIFRDDDEATASPDLGATIRRALEHSQALIVVCSPNAAASPWVDREVREFRALGRGDRIFALVVAGKPHDPEAECFPPALRPSEAGIEPLAVDVRQHGKRDAVLKLAAALLDVHFDALKRRDRRRAHVRRAIAIAVASSVAVAYTSSLLLQTRVVNTQAAAVLAALARRATDAGDHARALRLAVLATRPGFLWSPPPDARPTLARATHLSTLLDVGAGHRAPVYSVAWDGSGTRLVTGSQDGTVRLWRASEDLDALEPEGTIDVGFHVADARIVEGGDVLAIRPFGSGAVQRRRRSGGSWASFENLGPATTIVRSFDVNARGDAAIVGTQEGTLEVWRFDGRDWEREAGLGVSGEIAECAAISADGQGAAAAGITGSLRIWRRQANSTWVTELEIEKALVGPQRLRWSSDGDQLLAAAVGDVRILRRSSVGTWTETGRIRTDPTSTAAEGVTGDRSLLFVNGGNVAATLWSESPDGSWRALGPLGSGADSSRALAFHRDGSRMATVGNDGGVRLWKPGGLGSWGAYAKVVFGVSRIRDVDRWVEGHTGFTEPRVLSPDGRHEAIGDVYGIVTIRDVATGVDIASFNASDDPGYSLEWDASEALLHVRGAVGAGGRAALPMDRVAAVSSAALVDAVCSQELPRALRKIDEEDLRVAPLLRGRLGEDVCDPPSVWARTWTSIVRLFRAGA